MITSVIANAAIVAAIFYTETNKIPAENIAVVDTAGRLVAFERMDGAILAGGFGAIGKAVASALFNKASSALEPGINPTPTNPTLPYVEQVSAAVGWGPLFRQGAVPLIDKAGNFLGAIGCGGATAAQDEAAAKAGAAAVATQ